MANELQTKLDAILNDKNTNLLPEHLKAGVTCLGVEGTLAEAPAGSDELIASEGVLVSKELKNNDEDTPVLSTSAIFSYGEPTVVNAGGKFTTQISQATIANLAGLTPEKIISGNTILGVEGTAETGGGTSIDGVKLFETVEEMNTDVNPKENDLGLIYRTEIQPVTVSSEFSVAKFPSTVVLPEALTGSVDVMYRSVDNSVMCDCYGMIESSSATFSIYSETMDARIEYTSSDGITYTRTDGGEESVDFGTDVRFDYVEYWNDVIGYFIQAKGQYFGGLYQYLYNTDPTRFQFRTLDSISCDTTTGAVTVVDNLVDGVYDFNKIVELRTTMWNASDKTVVAFLNSKNELCLLGTNGNNYTLRDFILDTNGKLKYIGASDDSTVTQFKVYKIDLENGTYELVKTVNTTTLTVCRKSYGTDSTTTSPAVLISDLDMQTLPITLNSGNVPKVYSTFYGLSPLYTYVDGTQSYFYDENAPYKYYGYTLASTQLSLSNPNELLPGKIGYGKNGPVTGDGSIYNNSELLTPLMISNSLGNYKIGIHPSSDKEVGLQYAITDSTTSETNMSIIFQNYLYRNFDYTDNYNNNFIVDNETGLSLRFYKYDDYYIVFDCSDGSNYKYVKLDSNQKQLGVIDKPASVLGKPLGYNNLLFHLLRDSESGSSNYKITIIDLNTMTQVSTIRFVASTMYTSSMRLTVYNDTLYCCWTDTSNNHLHGVTTSLVSLTEEMTATETVSYTGKQLYSYSNSILNKKYFIVRNKTGDGTNVIDITTNNLFKTWSVNVGVSDTVRVYNEDKTKVLTGYESYIVNLTDMSISSSKYTVPASGYTMQSIYNTNYILSLTKTYLYEFDWSTLTFKTIFSHPYGGGYSIRFPFEDVITYESNKYVVFKTALGKAMMVSLLQTSEDYDIKVLSYDDSSRESLVTDIFSSNLILDKFQTISS